MTQLVSVHSCFSKLWLIATTPLLNGRQPKYAGVNRVIDEAVKAVPPQSLAFVVNTVYGVDGR